MSEIPSEWSAPEQKSALRRVVFAVVDFAQRFYLFVILGTLAITGGLFYYAKDIEARPDLIELLPRDSAGFRALEHQFARMGGGSTLLVVVTSPNRAANEKAIDAISDKLTKFVDDAKQCASTCNANDAACKDRCNDGLVTYLELNTKDVRGYFERNKWLYADLADLEKTDSDIDRQIALQSGMVEDLESDDAPAPAPKAAPNAKNDATSPSVVPAASTEEVEKKKNALGIREHLAKWEERANRQESYPTGYFANPDSTILGIRMVTNTYLGDPRADRLLAEMERMVSEVNVKQFDPAMEVGFTGDLAAAATEKKALMDEALTATLLALSVIMIGIVVFYRSAWALVIMAFPIAFGISSAYAFARWELGFVNAVGAFLGAILLGNGINYPIVLLSRYQDFRARGAGPEEAKRAAVYNALRAEFVGACVAAIAYGTLTLSDFRGFRQFGTIGFVGMLLVWISIVPLVPALLTGIEKLNPKLPPFLRMGIPKLREDGSRSRTLSVVSRLTTKHPWVFVLITVAVTARAVWHMPAYFADPWEYDFGRMGSKSSDKSGSGAWSDKANEVFGKTNIAGARMIADTPDQVPLIKQAMMEKDAQDPQGRMLQDVVTVADMLPGTAEEQKQKLEVLERIRSRLTPKVLSELDDEERKTVERATPPEDLKALVPADLPALIARRFTDSSGQVGNVFYVQPQQVNFADAHNHLRLSATIDNVKLPDGTVVMTASRSTIFAEILKAIRKDGPKLSLISFLAVAVVVIVAARNIKTAGAVLLSLLLGVLWLAGATAYFGERLNYVNFIAFPITFGIGSEYPFNIADRTRLLGGNVREAVVRSAGAVLLCSFTTVVGYGSLLYSDFQALVSFGKLAVVGEIACLYTAVFFLPSLLTLIERARRGKAPPSLEPGS